MPSFPARSATNRCLLAFGYAAGGNSPEKRGACAAGYCGGPLASVIDAVCATPFVSV
jgi:hypothetical protein